MFRIQRSNDAKVVLEMSEGTSSIHLPDGVNIEVGATYMFVPNEGVNYVTLRGIHGYIPTNKYIRSGKGTLKKIADDNIPTNRRKLDPSIVNKLRYDVAGIHQRAYNRTTFLNKNKKANRHSADNRSSAAAANNRRSINRRASDTRRSSELSKYSNWGLRALRTRWEPLR
jgi:hypothetical protein